MQRWWRPRPAAARFPAKSPAGATPVNRLAISFCRLAASLAVIVAASALHAGEFNPILKIGDPAPAWSNLPGTDDKTHSLADLKDKDAVVVVFTCNSCPIASDYEDRIIDFVRRHADTGRVALVAINVNKIEEDSLPKMKERAAGKHFAFPYLYDDSQKIAKDYGATYTPEFFVLDKNRRIAFMGGMDDNNDPRQAKVNYLDPAVAAVLAGEKPEVPEAQARGCMIRYDKKRRRKPS
jgi:peroxiredoxin